MRFSLLRFILTFGAAAIALNATVAAPSLPIAFAPSDWGSLPAFGVSGPPQTTKRIYGNRGNSFVAVVEFGPRVQAKTLLAGGVSGDPASPHFNDQAARYAAGKF